ERVSQLEKTTENQFNLGLAKKIDLDRIRVNKGNLRAQYEQLEYAVTQQENLLKYYMGMPIAQPIVIPETEVNKLESEAVVSLANGTFNVEQLVDYQVLKRQEDLLGLQRKSYVAEYYPTLSISGNYLYN